MRHDGRSSSTRGARLAGSHRSLGGRRKRTLQWAAKVAAVATGTAACLLVLAILGIGPIELGHGDRPRSATPDDGASSARARHAANSAVPTPATSPRTPRLLPLGPRTLSTIAERTTQVIVVRGVGTTSSAATVEYFERIGADWFRVAGWNGHVGKRGWSTQHVEGDLKTPAGTFTLSDAGGRKPDPASDLPYHQSAAFEPPAREPGFGDSMADSFDYVIAIDYNRVPGKSPLDPTRPLGPRRGGGIWLHVDHAGPTHGCVSVPQAAMRYLLLHLTPESHPVVVMGDAALLEL